MSTHEIIALVGLAIIVVLFVRIILIKRKASSLDAKLRFESAENSRNAEKLSGLIDELSALQMQKDKLDQHVQSIEKLRADLVNENDRLSKYRNIADADEKAAQMLVDSRSALQRTTSEAQAKANEIIMAAQVIKDKATAEANELSAGSKQEARTLKSEAKSALDNANLQVAKIIEEANKRAEQIAGSAYDAMKKADLYERTVKAMKNIIDGYGDQYIIPGRSLLDDLAEEFGFTDAGKELKNARERTKSMLRVRVKITSHSMRAGSCSSTSAA